jgi:hypothetical protein
MYSPWTLSTVSYGTVVVQSRQKLIEIACEYTEGKDQTILVF